MSDPVKKIKDNEGWEKKEEWDTSSRTRSGSEEAQWTKAWKQQESNDEFKYFNTFTALFFFLLSQLEECIP